jgi:hypothetical protein
MVIRTQISLDPELHRRAKERAADMGISLAEYLRRLVAGDLGPQRATTNASAVFNLGHSGGSDVARRKDSYVAEAYSARVTSGNRPAG